METIYFATNRKPNCNTRPTDFGKEFSHDGISNLRFGVAKVSDDEIEIKLAREKLESDKSGLRTDMKKSKFGSQKVFEKLRIEMQRHKRDTVIYIHGYNNSFADGLRDAARISRNFARVDDGHGVNVVLFSWPSDGILAPWKAYADDRRDAAASGLAFARGILKLVDFMDAIRACRAARMRVRRGCEQRLHLVAHSMGCYVLRHALQAIIHCAPSRVPKVFDQVFLMAADEDDDAFEHDHKLRVLPRIANRINVYFNREDVAIAVSDVTKGNPDRLGSDGLRVPSRVPAKVTQIDCTRVVRGVIEHSYHVRSSAVVQDMGAALDGLEPEDVPNRVLSEDRNRYVIFP